MTRNQKVHMVFAAVLLGGLFWIWLNYWRSYPMTEMDFETRTWCVGRYLVDMPVEFEMRFTSSGIGNSTSVEVFPLGPGTEEDLKRIVRDRVAALKLPGARANGNYRKYKYESQVNGVYIVANEDTLAPEYHALDMSDESFGLYYAEGYFLRGENIFHADAIILDERADADLSDLLQVAAATYPRANDEIPKGEGFCVDGAFVKLPIISESAHVLFSVPDAGTFGLQFSISERSKALSIVGKGKWRTIAKSRQVAGYDGEELRSIDANIQMLGFRYAGGLNKQAGDQHVAIKAYLYKQEQDIDAPPYNVDDLHGIWNLMLNSVRRR